MEKKIFLMMLLCMFFLKPELVNAKMVPMVKIINNPNNIDEEGYNSFIDLDGDGTKEVLKLKTSWDDYDSPNFGLFSLYIDNILCLEKVGTISEDIIEEIMVTKDHKNDKEKELVVVSYNQQTKLFDIEVYHYKNKSLKLLFRYSIQDFNVSLANDISFLAGDGKMRLPCENNGYKTYRIVNDQFYELEEKYIWDVSNIPGYEITKYCRSKSYPVQKKLKGSKTKFMLNFGDTFTVLKVYKDTNPALKNATDGEWYYYIQTDRGKEGWVKDSRDDFGWP